MPDPTVAQLTERYEREYVAMHCKPATISHYRLMLRKHIALALGERLVADIEYKDILAFHNSLHQMPTVANRAADMLVKMFNLADGWGWRPSGANPCRGVPRFRVEKHERFLSREELFRLGEALRAAPTERLASIHAAAPIRLLVLTGCRCNEVVTLKWEHVDLERDELRLPDTKTGARAAPLSPEAKQILTTLPRLPGNPSVFPGRVNRSRLCTLNASRQVVRKEAGLDDVRLHDLRHSFASRPLALGESLPMIGRLLGHAKVQTTVRYAHLGRHSVKLAAVRISDSLEADMDTPPKVSAAP